MHTTLLNNSLAGSYLALGLIFSALLHLSLVIFFLSEQTVELEPELRIFRVSLAEEEFIRDLREVEQLVSQPDVEEEAQFTPETRFSAERDTVVAEEQIRRGEPEAGPDPAPQAEELMAKERTAPQVERSVTGRASPEAEVREHQPLQHLTLDRGRALEKFATPPQQTEQESQSGEGARDIDSYSPFSRPRGSGAQFLGLRGSRDFLPDLPDGDITLLNTKANKFAVFVRRVASRVFGQLRLSGWESLRPEDIRMINRFSTVRAVLSLDGELLRVELEESSGSRRFDDILLDSVSKAARDYNPPPEAVAEDGNIHFIFKARSWTRPVSDARTGGFSERRWLLLGTGLD